MRFSLVNRARLAHSVIIVVGGKRLTSAKAGVAQLVAQTGQSATFVAAVAIFNPRPGAGAPRAHGAAGGPAVDTVATFKASTEGEDTVIVSVEFHQDILAVDRSGRLALCPKGSQVKFEFTRAELAEVAGPDLTPRLAEELFDEAVQACLVEANTTGEQLLSEWLDPGTPPVVSTTPPPGRPAFGGTFGGTTNAEGDPMRITLSGQFNRDISGVAVWAPPNTLFTHCDPTSTCKIGGYGGGTQNSVYFMVNVPANHPFPGGLNIELNHAGNYSDNYVGQATATDGSTSSWQTFHLSG
jgi:hypothetical protein